MFHVGKMIVSKKSRPDAKHKAYTSFLLPKQGTSSSEDDQESDDLISDTNDFSFTD